MFVLAPGKTVVLPSNSPALMPLSPERAIALFATDGTCARADCVSARRCSSTYEELMPVSAPARSCELR